MTDSASDLVTVVIPTHDRVQLLRRSLASVLAQQDVNLEVVVVDDGSSLHQAAAVADLAGDRVRVVAQSPSLGVAGARNRGIAEARGRWVAFCDDDDLWGPRKLRTQLDALDGSEARWAYAGAVKFAEGPVVWQVMPAPSPAQVTRRLAWKCLVPAGASNVLVATDEVRRLGGFDQDLRHMADWDLWLRLLEAGPPAAAAAFGVGYRLHPGAMSLQPDGILRELEVIDRRWRHLRDGRPLPAGPTHLWIGTSWLRAGHRARAAISFARATATEPRKGLRSMARTLYPPPPAPAHDPLRRAWPTLEDPVLSASAVDMHEALRTWGSGVDGEERS